MSRTRFDEAHLTESLRELAGRADPSPDALDAIHGRYHRHRRNRAGLTAAGAGALALLVAVAAVNLTRMGSDTEVSTDRTPIGAEGDGESATAAQPLLPAFISLPWLKPDHIGLYEGAPEERPDRWVQSSYRGERGRNAQLTVEHNPAESIEARAAEREGTREEVSGPRGSRVILISDRGRYWAYWSEGEWQFEVDSGAIPSRDEALEIVRGVVIDAVRFEELKLVLRDQVQVTRPAEPAVVDVVAEGEIEGTPWRVTELPQPEGQRCLGLEPDRAHRWFCLPSDAGAFTGEDPSIAPGPKVQIGDYWLYAALVEASTTVNVRTEGPDGVQTLTLVPAPLADNGMGVAVGFLPTTVETITTEFVAEDGEITYRHTQSMAGG